MYNSKTLFVKRYHNPSDGVRYNLSVSSIAPPSSNFEDKYVIRLHPALLHRSDCRRRISYLSNVRFSFNHVFTSKRRIALDDNKVSHKVRPPEQRDRTSILRAIRNIREIGLSNDWDYFVTFTLSPEKFDRTDYAGACEKITRYFRYLRKNKGYDLQYLLIPELHRDGKNWHFHGLMRGLPDSLLVPHPLKRQRDKGYKVWPDMKDRFGFTTLSPVGNASAVVYYCLKYINKDLFSQRINDGARLYYVSRGLMRPQKVSEFSVCLSPFMLNQYGFNVTPYSSAYIRGVNKDTLDSILLSTCENLFIDENIYKEFCYDY